ncbi:transporter [Lutibacter sp. B1]|uniref:transporter n=1 Tax=Lutibacter sp. B1 TaxID=2725996 RepID=UPI001457051B|nr:transporter [Lutibacter sp. B1]NLP59265.1 transporter [Lutibacter sp. B1]
MKKNHIQKGIFVENENFLNKINVLLIVIILILTPSTIFSQTQARDLLPAPSGLSALLFYQRNMSGNNLYLNGHKVNNNIDFNGDLSLFRYAHFFKTGKATLLCNVILPYASMNLELGEINDKVTGLGDITLNAVYFYPLITKEKNNLFLDAAFYLTPPTGKYYSNKEINIGSNRWAYRITLASAWKTNRTAIEIVSNLDWYSDNNDFTADKLKQEQNAVYMFETHLTYDFTKTFYGGVTYRWKKGGETNVEGIGDMNDKINTQQFNFMGTVTITSQTQVMILYSTDFEVKNGIAQNYLEFRLAYFF